MISDFSHCIAHGRIGVEQVVMLTGIPLIESGEFLRDGLEKTDDNSHWRCLHVVAKFLHSDSILQIR